MPKLKEIKGYPTLGIDVRSGLIYLRGSYPGLGQVVRSTRERDLGRAIKAAKLLEREILKLDPHYTPQTVREVWEEIKTVRSLEWRKRSLESATWVVETNILPHFGSLPIDAMTDVRWAKFVKDFKTARPGQKLFNTQKCMKMITNHAHKKGYLREKLDLRFKDAPEREGLEMPREHFRRLLAACEKQEFCDDDRFWKLRLFCHIGYYMGCRPGEIMGLTWERVDFEANVFRFGKDDVKTGSKTNRGRTIEIAPEVLVALREAHAKRTGIWVFPARNARGHMKDIHQTFGRAVERANKDEVEERKLPLYTPNDLRHTFFTRKILAEKMPITDVAIYGGTSVRMLEKRYLHNQSEYTKNVVQSKANLRVVRKV